MSKIKTGFNTLFAFLLFLFGFAKGVVGRVFPASGGKPVAKVFALSDAAWADLRATDTAAGQQQAGKGSDQKGADQKKDESKGNDSSKSTDKKDQAKGNCEKTDEKKGDESKTAPPSDCKDKGTGGGDGDLGGTGG